LEKTTARLCFLAAVSSFVCSLAHSQTSIIPQIVDGGAWLTTIAVTNTGSSQEIVSLTFFQETGGGNTSSWNLAFQEGSAAGLVLQPASTIFLHTFGTAATTTIGWGQLQELDAAGAVAAYAIFTQRVPGRSDQDGTAPAAAAVSRILVPFDNVNGAVTSMAVANATASSETINVGIRIGSSTSQPSALMLPANGHASFTFPTQFTATAGQSGLAEFYAPSGSFSILALKFNSGAFTTAPVYSVTGPPIIASSSSGGGGGVPNGNIVMAGFSVGKINTTSGSYPATGAVTDGLGGQFASYTPAEWNYPFTNQQQFGSCTVLSTTTPAGGKPPYGADAYLDAGTITASGPGLPQGFALSVLQEATGKFYYYTAPAGVTLQLGGTYTISSTGGSQVGPFSISATLPTSFSVTNWNALTSINRASGLTVNWTGAGFDEVNMGITGAILTTSTTQSTTVSCTVAASLGTFTIPPDALAMLPALQTGNASSVGQLVVGTIVSTPGTSTGVSSTAQTLVPNLVGGGQVNYGFFAPSLALIQGVSIQ